MSVLSNTQALKFENFQMEKYKQMNKDLLDEETNSDLIALCKTLLVDIDNAIDLYRKVAKARGQPYDVKKRGEADGDAENNSSNNQEIASLVSKKVHESQKSHKNAVIGSRALVTDSNNTAERPLIKVDEENLAGDSDKMEGPFFENPDTEDEEDEEQEKERFRRNKKYLLEWVVEADFAKEFSLIELGNTPFEVPEEE